MLLGYSSHKTFNSLVENGGRQFPAWLTGASVVRSWVLWLSPEQPEERPEDTEIPGPEMARTGSRDASAVGDGNKNHCTSVSGFVPIGQEQEPPFAT